MNSMGEITTIEDVSLFLLKSIILKMVVGTKKTMFVRDLANP